jgi:hypothetical protein
VKPFETKESYSKFKQSIRCPDIGKDPLQFVLENGLVPPTGLLLEFGVYSGKTINTIAAAMKHRTVYGFDSFEGLPEAWDRGNKDKGFHAGFFNRNGTFPDVLPNVSLVKGWFHETLTKFKKGLTDQIALLHIDCDLYSSTKTVFEEIGHLIGKGTIIVFDELFNYPNAENHELLALYEFLKATGHQITWIGKNGPVVWNAKTDVGAHLQSAAIRIEN